MRQNNNLKKFPSLALHTDMAEICRPFFQRSNFNFLNIIRLYENGKVSYLCENPAWLQHYLANGFPSIGAFEQNPTFQQHEYVLWSALGETDPILIYTREMFNLHQGITLIAPFAGGYDYFNFGTFTKDRALLDNLPAQVEELRVFCKNLQLKIKHMLTDEQSYALDLSTFNKPTIQAPKNRRLHLGSAFNYAHLTSKELSCLQHLIQGKTVPEIAVNQCSSTRTVEKHIENLKLKLGCKTQCELGYLTAKLNIEL